MMLYMNSVGTSTFYGVTNELVQKDDDKDDMLTILDTSPYYYTMDEIHNPNFGDIN